MSARKFPFAAIAVSVAGLGLLAGCGESSEVAEARDQGVTVGDAIVAWSEENDADISTAISQEPWAGESDAFVTGRPDFLVVNIRTGACAKLEFEADEPGAAYEVVDAYECTEVAD